MALLRRSTFSPAQPWARQDAPFSPGGDGEQSSSPHNIAKTVSYLRLADGSGTTLVEQVRPALGWRCRCSLFRSREARKGTSFGVEP